MSARYQTAATFWLPMPVTVEPLQVGLLYATPLTVFAPLPSLAR